jgi:hypothetical protein
VLASLAHFLLELDSLAISSSCAHVAPPSLALALLRLFCARVTRSLPFRARFARQVEKLGKSVADRQRQAILDAELFQ